jgi:hypothetical protein
MLGLALLCAGLLLKLAREADRVHASLVARAAEAPADAAVAPWRVVLRFDQAKAPAALLRRGWSAPEFGSGAWSMAGLAVLQLPPSPARGPAVVVLSVEPFVAAAHPVQRVRVRAGARVLGEWRLTGGTSRLAFQLPGELNGPDGLELQIDLPDAASPARDVRGAMDARLLGVKLHAVELFG